MKGYKKTYHKFLNGLYKPKNLLILSLVVLLIPNALLCFTEHLHLLVCVCNMALPIAFYLGILTVSHNVGRNVWLLLPVVFLCAFQLVLLYLFWKRNNISRYVSERRYHKFGRGLGAIREHRFGSSYSNIALCPYFDMGLRYNATKNTNRPKAAKKMQEIGSYLISCSYSFRVYELFVCANV